MYGAWRYLTEFFEHEGDYVAEGAFVHAHRLIKGDEFGGGRYRTTPVTFRDGGHAANHQNIDRLMENLFGAINNSRMWTPNKISENVSVSLNPPDLFAKEFLDIHPFSDGNGRVASLLWNRLRDTLADPEPLPYFYGEKP